MSRWVTGTAAGILLTAVLLALTSGSAPPPKLLLATKELPGYIPTGLDGWSTVDRPIADSEEMKRAVSQALHYDTAVFRSYARSLKQFDVYAAYWKPGEITTKDVASHTPDICWVTNGWKLEQGQERLRLPEMTDAQYRVFTIATERRFVAYWHFADGQMVDYKSGGGVAWWASPMEVLRRGRHLKPEQLFVRISSPRPIEELQGEPMFRLVLEKLAALRWDEARSQEVRKHD